MASLESRIQKLEQAEVRAQNWRNYETVAAEFGLNPYELMEDCEQFYALSPQEQLVEIDAMAQEFGAAGEIDGLTALKELRELLMREYWP